MATVRQDMPVAGSPPFRAEAEDDVPPWLLPFTAYEALTLALTLADPRAGLGLAGGVGRLASRLAGYASSPDEVGALFPELSPARRVRIAREIAAGVFKNRALRRLVQVGGLERLAPWVRWQGVERLQRLREKQEPVVLITWHMGPLLGIAAGLLRLKMPVLVIRATPVYRPPPNIEVCLTWNRPELGRQAFERAVGRLRAGGMVILAVDGGAVSTRPVVVLGRPTVFASGAAKLARMTGATVIPIITHWGSRGAVIDVVVDDPLPSPRLSRGAERAFENALLAEAAKRWEVHIRAAAEELHPQTVERLLTVPKLGQPGLT